MLTNKTDIEAWLKKYNIKNYLIHDNLVVDVSQHASLANIEENQLPVQFGQCRGHFFIENSQLQTLKGVPNEIVGYFYIKNNLNLNELDYLPQTIGKDFIIEGTIEISSLINLDKSSFDFLEIFTKTSIKELNDYELKDNQEKLNYCLKYDSVINKVLPRIRSHYEKKQLEDLLKNQSANKKMIKV